LDAAGLFFGSGLTCRHSNLLAELGEASQIRKLK
jgi:hypothetical protein